MKRPGFTLSECLLVLAIVGILLTLLTAAVQTAQLASNVTLCQRNLCILYQAEVLRMCDLHTTTFASGPGWNDSLLPYVEGRMEVFLCPASVGPLDISGGAVTQTSGGGGQAGNGGAPVLPGFDISFDVYSNASFTNFIWNVSINSIWCRSTANYNANDPNMPPAYTWRYQIEDRGFLVEETGDWRWADDYADIDVAVTYDGSTPTFIKIIQAKNGSQGYRYNMLINGTMVVHNIDDHQGLVLDLRPQQSGGGGGNPGGSGSTGTGGSGTTVTSYTYFPCDYGMSVGSYSVPNLEVTGVDAKLFLLLDYPKHLADYNIDGEDYGQGDKYFITDPAAWKTAYDPNNTGPDWTRYQALRHYKMANVLFCDGHIELLPWMYDSTDEQETLKYLYQDNPLWVYGKPAHTGNPMVLVADTDSSGERQAAGSSSAPASGQDQDNAAQDNESSVVAVVTESPPLDVEWERPQFPDPQLAVSTRLYWAVAGAADLYINGKPVRKFVPDFRTRELESDAVFMTDVVLHDGDVITVGVRRDKACGFLLVAVDPDGAVVWATDEKHWNAYVPKDPSHWWRPSVVQESPKRSVKAAPDAWPGRLKVEPRGKGAAHPIWGKDVQETYLFSVIRIPVGAAAQSPPLEDKGGRGGQR